MGVINETYISMNFGYRRPQNFGPRATVGGWEARLRPNLANEENFF